MRYLVTGATGFIGGHLVGHLLRDGHQVVALVRDPDRARQLESAGVELVRGDILDRDSLRDPMRGVDGVYHLAAWYRLGARHRERAHALNVDGTRNVLEAAGEAGVPRILYTSTLAVYGDTGGKLVHEGYRMDGPWLSEYDRTKWLAHYEVAVPMAEAGLPLVIAQPGLVYGPGDHSSVGTVLRDYLRRRLPVIPEQGGCWAFVEDTARGLIQAMENGRTGRSYHLAGEAKMWKEVLGMAEEITGIRAPRFTLKAPLARLSSILMRPIAAIAPVPATYHPETLRVAAGVTYFGDDTRAREEIGWSPRPLREGLALTLRRERQALGI
ncbi:MAG TPA: NAD-dependent epimerase/dehydratase family protein [Longimicrobiales bacterium]|nr:NAD-dependent epimerase/dehydratase family protein [Longimicrobiales bacterium]